MCKKVFVTTLPGGFNTQRHENKLTLCYLHVLLSLRDTDWPSICKSNILKDKNNFCWKEKVICSLINCISMCILIFCRAIVHKPIQSLNCTTKLLNSMRRKMYALYCAIWLVHWILFNCKTYSGGMLHVLFIKDP